MPRFHLAWGTGPGIVENFVRRCVEHETSGVLQFNFRQRIDRVEMENGLVKGVSGAVLAADNALSGQRTNRHIIGDFALLTSCVLVTSGGIGGNFDLVRKAWPTDRLGPAPTKMIAGVPAHMAGRMIALSEAAGGHVINADRKWHDTEGVRSWNPIWPAHGIRILPGLLSLWFDAEGNRLAQPALPGFDSMGTLRSILKTGYDYSWFVLTQRVIEKEFALSKTEQNPDRTSKKVGLGDQAARSVRWLCNCASGSVQRERRRLCFGQQPDRAFARHELCFRHQPHRRRKIARPDRGAGQAGRQSRFQGRADDGDPRRADLQGR